MKTEQTTKVACLYAVLALLTQTLSQAQSWTNKASLPQQALPSGTRAIGIAALGGKFYTVGGLDWPNAISTLLQYDPARDTWTRKADMLSARYAPAAAAIRGRLYALGGLSNQTAVATVECYNPVSNTWTNKAQMQNARWAFQAVALAGKIYAMGGLGGGNSNPTDVPYLEQYDPLRDTWTQKAAMPTPRNSFGAAAVNGKIYVIGGYDYNGNHRYIAEVYEYNPRLDSWTIKGAMSTSRETLGVVAVGGRILTLGGSSPGLARATIEQYIPRLDAWTTKADMPQARNECFALVSRNTLYAFGGYDDWTMDGLLRLSRFLVKQ